MTETDVKTANRYEFKLKILAPNNEEMIFNYWDFLSKFGYDKPKSIKAPLADIDRHTTSGYQSKEHFHEIHKAFFSSENVYPQFLLLTNCEPSDCIFESYIEYISNRRPAYYEEPKSEIKQLETIYGDNKMLSDFVRINPTKSFYDLTPIMPIMWEFYKKLIFDDYFFEYAVKRISGLQKNSNYTAEDSRLLKQMKECRKKYEEENYQFGVLILDKLRHYKSLRAATMIMTEYNNRLLYGQVPDDQGPKM